MLDNVHLISSLLNIGLWVAYAVAVGAFVKEVNEQNKFGNVTLFASFIFIALLTGFFATLNVGLPNVGIGIDNFMYVFGATSLMGYFYLPEKKQIPTLKRFTRRKTLPMQINILKGGVS